MNYNHENNGIRYYDEFVISSKIPQVQTWKIGNVFNLSKNKEINKMHIVKLKI